MNIRTMIMIAGLSFCYAGMVNAEATSKIYIKNNVQDLWITIDGKEYLMPKGGHRTIEPKESTTNKLDYEWSKLPISIKTKLGFTHKGIDEVIKGIERASDALEKEEKGEIIVAVVTIDNSGKLGHFGYKPTVKILTLEQQFFKDLIGAREYLAAFALRKCKISTCTGKQQYTVLKIVSIQVALDKGVLSNKTTVYTQALGALEQVKKSSPNNSDALMKVAEAWRLKIEQTN